MAGEEDSFGALGVLNQAIRKVPVLKYAMGLVGVAAALAITRGLLPDVGLAAMFPVFVGSIIAMAVLLILAAAAGQPAARRAKVANVFLWATCIFVIVLMAFTVSAIALGQPTRWAEIILPKKASETPLLTVNGVDGAAQNSSATAQTPAAGPQDIGRRVEDAAKLGSHRIDAQHPDNVSETTEQPAADERRPDTSTGPSSAAVRDVTDAAPVSRSQEAVTSPSPPAQQQATAPPRQRDWQWPKVAGAGGNGSAFFGNCLYSGQGAPGQQDGVSCGRPAADAFCRLAGFTEAASSTYGQPTPLEDVYLAGSNVYSFYRNDQGQRYMALKTVSCR